MSFVIEPYKRVGVIEFGMTPEKVRACLGGGFKSFKRTPAAAMPCDYYDSLGVFIYYKLPGEVEAIELAAPACPELDNQNLLALSFSDLKKLLIDRDQKLEIESDSLISYSLGIGVYAPDADEEPGLPAESVIVFEKDYYD